MMPIGASSNKRSQFRLVGPQKKSDARITAVRGDLADIAIAGDFFAPHYATAKLYSCIAPSATISASPDEEAVSQLLYGEAFAVLDIAGNHAWGYCASDNYVGYIAADALGDAVKTTHQIDTRGALIFAEPSIKSPIVMRLPMGAQITAQDCEHENFMQTEGGFVHKRHASPVGKAQADSADLARKLMGAPYLWGGRSGDGLDCSGLVQMVLGLQGIEAPRDSDQQQVLGQEVADNAPLLRNDIIFFPGHVGIMGDDKNLIHANAHWMQVVEEPLDDVVARIEDGGITARRRL